MRERYIFFFILGVDAFILLFQMEQLSISYSEAEILYGKASFLQFLVKLSLSFFGQNDFGLRFVMVLLQMLSAFLMYEISKEYIALPRNRIWFLVIFLLLPGAISSAVIVNSAGLLLFFLLLFVYAEKRIKQRYLNVLLLFYPFIDVSFSYLFIALSIYYFVHKKRGLSIYMVTLCLLTAFLHGFEIGGYPTGHFLDAIGVYSAIFTPIIFIYIFYTLYKRYFSHKRDLMWCIATVVLLLSLLLSFRQSLPLEHFAPYLMLALPLAASSFISSYRVRLKMYRIKYKIVFIFSLIFLILNTLMVFFNKELYRVIEKPSKHFAYDMQVAKELSRNLQSKDINCVKTDKQMQLRLRFYGISKCNDVLLTKLEVRETNSSDVTIRYSGRAVYRANVTKINNR